MTMRWLGRALALIGFLMVLQSLAWMSRVPPMGASPSRLANGEEAATAIPSPALPAAPSPTPAPSPMPTATPTPVPPTPTPTPGLPARWALTPTPPPAPVGVPEGAPPPRPLLSFPPGRVNLLLLGSDRRPGERVGRTDTIILVSIDPEGPSARLLSIPRDLWMYIPGWQSHKINTAYPHGELSGYPGGGYGLLRDTLRYNLGIVTHGYALVDFQGMRAIIDALGGVDVLVRCPLYDVFPDPDDPTITGTLNLPAPGYYHLDGKQALWYMRSRYSTGDADRARRQQQVLEGMLDRLKEGGWLSRAPALWSGLRRTVQTDLGLDEVLWLASLGLRMDRSRIARGSLHPVVASARITTTSENELFIYLPTEQTYAYLERFLLGPLPSQASPLTRVELINASGNALYAGMAVEILREAGFGVVRTAEVEPDGRPSRVLALHPGSSAGAAQSLLRALHLPASRLESAPEPGAEVAYRIWLGADFNPCGR